MGSGTELIFVEGHSSDDTYAAIERAIAAHPERRCRLLHQTGNGKGDAVRLGFAEATRRRPDDPRRRPHGAARGSAAVLRGARVRQRRVRQRRAPGLSRWNDAGHALPQPARQQVLQRWRSRGCSASRSRTRSAAPRCSGATTTSSIAANRAYFGDFDPFGDFDLLFGAAKLNLKIVDLPDPLPRAHLRRRPTSSAGGTAGCCCAWWVSRPAG